MPKNKNKVPETFEEVLSEIEPLISSFAFNLAKRISTDLIEDLEQEGRIALFKVWKNYEPSPKCKFSTFASFAIIGAMKRYAFRNISNIRVSDQYNNKNFWKAASKSKKEEGIKNIIVSISLDKPSSEDSSISLKDTIADEKNFWEEIERRNSSSLLKEEMLKTLSKEEVYVLARRFGLVCEGSATLEQVGREMNTSKQRVFQREKQALGKLKKCSNFEDYLKKNL